MNPRLTFALTLLVACALAGVIGVALARTGDDPSASAPEGLELTNGWAGAVSPPGVPALDFRLRDQDGRPASLAAYRGRPLVLSFMYSTCEDTCPSQTQAIRGALDDLGHDVPVIAISVDPANDTPSRARRYLVEQRMTGRMDFLVGSRAQLAPVWKAYGVQPQGEGFEHSARVLILDGEGRQRIAFPAEKLVSDALEHDLRRIEREAARTGETAAADRSATGPPRVAAS